MSYMNKNNQHEQESPTVVVDVRKQGDYTTITAALAAVKAGARILVRPGLYKEGIVIDKPVEIIGDGKQNEIVIAGDGRNAVLFQANKGRIANLMLRQTGSGSWWKIYNGWYAVDIAQGRLELEDCDISSQGRACVAIHNGADPRLCRCRIHDGRRDGVFVFDNGKGTLEDNEIFANRFCGVTNIEGGSMILRRNRIAQNGNAGILVDGGSGIFEDNDLRGNRKGAWLITPDCKARVQRKGNIE